MRRVIKANQILLKRFGLSQENQIVGTTLEIHDSQIFQLREELIQVDGEEYWVVAIPDT